MQAETKFQMDAEPQHAAHPPPYPQPNPSYGPGPPPLAGGSVIVAPVVPGAVIITQSSLGRHPCNTTCRNCSQQVVTRVEFKTVTKTHLLAGLLCLLGCWCCVCIPYCIDSTKKVEHYCPQCSAFVGSG